MRAALEAGANMINDITGMTRQGLLRQLLIAIVRSVSCI